MCIQIFYLLSMLQFVSNPQNLDTFIAYCLLKIIKHADHSSFLSNTNSDGEEM